MKFSNKIKYLTIRQNIIFLLFSLLIILSWMFICVKIDQENDRGLLTIFGYSCIVSFILILFFSNNKAADFFTLIISLSASCLIIFLLVFTLGLIISMLFSWAGLIVPLISTGYLIFYNLRLLFSFPDNAKAFWVIVSLPTATACILYLLPFYNSIFAHEYGIGFPISIFLSLLFISISISCQQNNTKNTNSSK